MAQVIRTFLAIDPPDENKAAILGFVQNLSHTSDLPVRWVSEHNLHITIKFLGEFREEDTQKFEGCLRQGLEVIQDFPIALNLLGAFPTIRNPRTLWLGFDCPGPLKRIYQIVETCCAGLGYPSDARAFSPHLTMGRVRKPLTTTQMNTLGEVLNARKNDFASDFQARSLIFFKSDLTRTGPIYSEQFKINFQSKTTVC